VRNKIPDKTGNFNFQKICGESGAQRSKVRTQLNIFDKILGLNCLKENENKGSLLVERCLRKVLYFKVMSNNAEKEEIKNSKINISNTVITSVRLLLNE